MTERAREGAERIERMLAQCAAPSDVLRLSEEIKRVAMDDASLAVMLAERLIQRGRDAGAAEAHCVISGHTARAHALCYLNRFDEAVADLDTAQSRAMAERMEEELGTVMLVRVQPLARLGRLDEACRSARSGADHLLRAGKPALAARALVNEGIVRRMQGRADEAINCFDRAEEHLAADPVSRGALESNRAEAFLDLDRFSEASAAFGRALATFEVDDKALGAALVRGNMADVCSRMGQIDEALRQFEAARAVFASLKAEGDEARLLAEEAEAYLTIGSDKRAMRMYTRSLAGLTRAGLKQEEIRARIGLARALLHRGSADAAERELRDALALSALLGTSALTHEAELGLAAVLCLRDATDEARALALSARRAFADRPLRRLMADATLVEIDLAAGCTAQAAERAQGLITEELHAPAPLRARVSHLRGRALLAMGQRENAKHELVRASLLADRFRGSIRAEVLRVAYLSSSRDVFLDLVRTALSCDPPDLSAAFMALERVRARTLLDACAGTEGAARRARTDAGAMRGSVGSADGAGAEGVSMPRADVMEELNALYSRLGHSPGRSPDDARVQARLLELERDVESATLRGSGRAFASGQPWSPDRVCSSLPQDGGVVMLFADGPEEGSPGARTADESRATLSALVLRREGLQVVRHICGLARTRALGRRLQFERSRVISTGAGSGFESVLRELWREVMEPLRPRWKGLDRLWLVQAAELHHIPWHAMPVLESGLPLVSYAPGVSIGLELSRARSTGTTPRTVCVGVADAWSPRAEDEATEVASVWPGADRFVGAGATAEAFLETMRRADVIHLATHAVFDAAFPLASRVKMADRWVTAREIVGTMSPGCVVVLAACHSGRESGEGESAREAEGEDDQTGLVRALLASGAGAVVSSLWELHDETSRDVLVEFHRELRRQTLEESSASADSSASAARAACPALAHAQRVHARTRGARAELWSALQVKGGIG